MRLEQVIASVRPLHTEVLKPVHRRVSTSSDPAAKLHSHTSRSLAMGGFYECVTRAFFGGEPGEATEIEGIPGRADLIDAQANRIFESKACNFNIHCHLLDKQMAFYEALQRDTEADGSLVIYRHRMPMNWKGTVEQLFDGLSQKTLYAVSIPFAMMQTFYRSRDRKLVYRWEAGESTFDSCTNINRTSLRRLLTEPEQVVSDLGLKPVDYAVTRYASPRITVDGHRLQRFPLVVISQKL